MGGLRSLLSYFNPFPRLPNIGAKIASLQQNSLISDQVNAEPNGGQVSYIIVFILLHPFASSIASINFSSSRPTLIKCFYSCRLTRFLGSYALLVKLGVIVEVYNVN